MAHTLAEEYLDAHGGSVQSFRRYQEQGNRLGQAFFNALSKSDRDRLRGHELDPFYIKFNDADLSKVMNFLLETKDK